MVTWVRYRPETTRQVHDDVTGPRPGQEFIPWVKVRISWVHCQAQLQHSQSCAHLQHTSGAGRRPGAARKYQAIWPHILAADMGTPQLRMVKEFRVN